MVKIVSKYTMKIGQSNRFATEKDTCSQSGLIKIAKNRLFDVVLLDCNMPCINGIEVAKEILAVNPHQRIIFASAYVKDTVTDSIMNLKQSKNVYKSHLEYKNS